MVAAPDLAARLRLCQTPLRRQLSRADALAEMIRAVNASLDPARVAEALLGHLAELAPGHRLGGDRRPTSSSASGRWPPAA